jgi:hypothetical protein
MTGKLSKELLIGWEQGPMRLGREVLFFWNKIPVGYEPGFLIIYGFLVCWKQVSRGVDQVPSWLATGIQKLGMAFLKFRNRAPVAGFSNRNASILIVIEPSL